MLALTFYSFFTLTGTTYSDLFHEHYFLEFVSQAANLQPCMFELQINLALA